MLTKAADPRRRSRLIEFSIITAVVDVLSRVERPRCSQLLHDVAMYCRSVWYGIRVSYGVVVQIVVAAVQAVAQGVLLCYKTIFTLSEKKIMQHVARDYRFSDLSRDPLLDYLEETRMGCEKEVSFATGRNLIMYAVDMMESKSPNRYISGTTILDALTSLQEPSSSCEDLLSLQLSEQQNKLMKQLLTGNVIHKLVETLSPRSPYDRETRVCAARILAHVAGNIHLDELPRAMRYIASLLVTFQEYPTLQTYQRDWELECFGTLVREPSHTPFGFYAGDYKELVLPGLRIVGRLAGDDDNWRIMSRDTDGLVAMITAPVSSNGSFHDDHHEEWTAIADGFLQLISQLMPALAKSHDKLQQQIASTKQALINTIASILKCPECHGMYKQAVGSLLMDIHVDTSSALPSESRENFINGLLSIFLDIFMHSSIRELAGKMLSSESESNAKIILDQDHKLRDGKSLFDMLRNANARNSVCRIHAADILKHLCTHYTNDDELLKYLKGEMIDSIKKVLKEILQEESNGEIEASTTKFSALDTDVEAQNSGLSSQDTEQQNNNSASSTHEQNGEQISEAMKLQAALISLCDTIYDIWISADPDLGRKLDEAAAEFCSEQGRPISIFTTLVNEAHERLDRKKAQELATNASASSSSTAT